MSRTAVPIHIQDTSVFARALARELGETEKTPSHVQLLNMLARAAGYRNFQHLRAQQEAQSQLSAAPEVAPPVDFVLVKQLARHFDEAGRLAKWPGKQKQRQYCLWVMWAALPAATDLTEKAVNEILKAQSTFGDHVLLRRDLVDGGWVTRTRDGAVYRRIERKPSAEAVELIRHVKSAEA